MLTIQRNLAAVAEKITGLNSAMFPFSPFSKTPAAQAILDYAVASQSASKRVIIVHGTPGADVHTLFEAIKTALDALGADNGPLSTDNGSAYIAKNVSSQGDIDAIAELQKDCQECEGHAPLILIADNAMLQPCALDFSAINHKSLSIFLTSEDASVVVRSRSLTN